MNGRKCSGLSRLWHLPSVSLLPWDSSRLIDLKDYNVINKLWEMCVVSSDTHTGTYTQTERFTYRNSHIDTYTCTHTYTNTLSDTQRNTHRDYTCTFSHTYTCKQAKRDTQIYTHIRTHRKHILISSWKKGWLNKSLEKIFVDEKAM